MKKFYTKILFFISLSISLFCVFSIAYRYILNHNQKDSSAIYVWGDSQIYQGLNIDLLSRKLNKKIYSGAKHGAGVYDFLTFCEYIPDHSTCIIGFSPSCFIRDINLDNNRSGFLCKPCLSLLKNNYSLPYILKIGRNNKYLPNKRFHTQFYPFAYADSITTSETLKNLSSEFDSLKGSYFDKIHLFSQGVDQLKHKQCKIILVQFYYESYLDSVYSQSKIKTNVENYREEILEHINIYNMDTISITSRNDSILMHDYTHLNTIGANMVTNAIISLDLENSESNRFIDILYNNE